MRSKLLWMLPTTLGLACCAPALNWREWRSEGAALRSLLPCKPSLYARPWVVADAQVMLHLAACSAGGATWAVAHADVVVPSAVPGALQAMLKAASANVEAPPPPIQPWSPPGATPASGAGRARVEGRLPDGRQVINEVAVFAHGTLVFQATVVQRAADLDGVETFFAGLSVRP